MGALVPGILLLGFFLFAARKRSSGSTSGGSSLPADSPWKLVPVKESGGEVFIDVFAKAGAFGPHQEMRVLRYKDVPSGQRVLILETPGVPAQITAAARDDFGLIQAPVNFG